MKPTKTIIALMIATLTLAALTTTATARNISFSNTAFRATWTSFEFTGGFGTTRCSLTLEGSLRSATFAKVRNAETGSVTNASIGSCAAGGATVLKEALPWKVQYSAFTGTLPNITSIRASMLGFAFRFTESLFAVTCLARSSVEHPALGIYNLGARGEVRNVTLGGTGIPCEGFTGGLGGTSSTNSGWTITLI